MAITKTGGFGSFGSGVSGNGPNASAVAGDFLLTIISVKANASTFTCTAGGFTKIGEKTQAGLSGAVFYKRATGSGDTPSFSWSGSGSWECITQKFSGVVASGGPVGAASVTGGTASPISVPSLTTQANNSLVVAYHQSNGAVNVTHPGAPWSTLNDANSTGDGFASNMEGTTVTLAGTASPTASIAESSSVAWVLGTIEIINSSQSVTRTLVATDVRVGSPVIGSPVLHKVAALTVSNIRVGSPTLGPVSLGGSERALTAPNVRVGSPTMGSPLLALVRALTAGDIRVGSPVIGAPALVRGATLLVDDIRVGSPIIDNPVYFSPVRPLVPSDVRVGSPIIGPVTVGLLWTLSVDDIRVGSPVIGAPELVPVTLLAVADIRVGSPVIGRPQLTKHHVGVLTEGPYFIAWADYGEMFDNEFHTRWDDDIFEYDLSQSEGDFAMLRLTIRNPRIGLLAPGRKRWAWFSRLNADGVAVPLFFGRIVGVPENIQDEVVEINFIARPEDVQLQKEAIANEERDYGAFDGIWFDGNKEPDPDDILEHMTKLWHFDRLTMEVSLSDIVNGEDGTLEFGPDRALYDNVQLSYSQNPIRRVNMTATVSWDQAGSGSVDITKKITDAFAKTYPPGFGGGAIATRTGEGLQNAWPKTGGSIGGGWTWKQSDLTVVSGQFDSSIIGDWIVNPNNSSDSFYVDGGFDTSLGVFATPAPGEVIGWSYHVVIPLWRMTCAMVAQYDVTRRRSETLTFTLEADVQDVVSEPDDLGTLDLTMSSSEVVDQGRIPATARSYFGTVAGTPSVEYLLMIARAHLIARARCAELSFDIPLDDAIDLGVNLRKSAIVNDLRMPGQFVSGKITAYTFSLRDGKENANVTISATVGRDGTVVPIAGEPDWIEDDYIEEDYQIYVGRHVVPASGDVSYESIEGQSPNDDGIDLNGISPDQAVKSCVVTGNLYLDNQQAALALYDIQVDESGQVTATNTTFAQVQLTMRNLQGTFETVYSPATSQLKIPRLIDLEALPYE